VNDRIPHPQDSTEPVRVICKAQHAYLDVAGKRSPAEASSTPMRIALEGMPEVAAALARGDARIALSIGVAPVPVAVAGETVVAATYVEFEDAPRLRGCCALIVRSASAALALLPADDAERDRIAEVLAAAILREVQR